MIETVLAVDIGTTSLKSGLITREGEVVSFYTYRFQDPNDRFIANEWLFAFNISVRRLMGKFGFAKTKNAIYQKISSIQQKIVPFQNNNGDNRSDGENDDGTQTTSFWASSSNQEIADAVHICAVSISGNGPTVVLPNGMTVRWNEKTPEYKVDLPDAKFSLFLPKILTLKNLFTDNFNKSPYIFSGPEYLIYLLTGKPVTILPEARFESAYWNDKILASCDIPSEKLPPFTGVGKLCGNISHEQITSMNLGKYLDDDIPVFSAGPDFIAAMIGTNTLEAGKVCDRSGSSEGFNFCIPHQIFYDGARSLPSVIPGLWNISILTPNSSGLFMDKRLQRVVFSINKLRQIARENNLDFPDSMVVTGGQAKSGEFMKRKAKALHMNLIVSDCVDAELIGDACCGWYGLGAYTSLQEAARAIFKKSIVYKGL